MNLNKTDLTDKTKKTKRWKRNLYFTKLHTRLYITTYRMFLDNKILGVGVKNFRNFYDNKKYQYRIGTGSKAYTKFSCSSHP